MPESDNYNARRIATEEVVERLKEWLDDFRQDGMMSSQAYQKKNGTTNILRAINHADRLVCRDMYISPMVVAYVPADETTVIFSNQDRYQNQIQTAINDAGLSNPTREWFLGNFNSIYVIEIVSRHLYVFSDYPASGERSTGRIRKISSSEYNRYEERFDKNTSLFFSQFYTDNRRSDAVCYFSPDDNRLVLGQKFSTDKFLQFEARLMPGIMNVKDAEGKKADTYHILAPHTSFELLLYEAMMYLLPASSVDARRLVQSQMEIERHRSLAAQPVDKNVVVPHHSYG